MRTQTFISSMVGVVAAVAVAGSANAAVAFDSFTVSQSESNMTFPVAGINWASPAASQPIFGASGTRAAFAYNYGSGPTTTSSVSSGTATFSTNSHPGYAGLSYSGEAQDLTGYTFSFYLNSTVATVSDYGFYFDLSGNDNQSSNLISYTGAGMYTVDLRPVQVDLTAISTIKIYIYADSGSATVSNFGYVPAAVPAPGAAALIGLAGMVATRRRRN